MDQRIKALRDKALDHVEKILDKANPTPVDLERADKLVGINERLRWASEPETIPDGGTPAPKSKKKTKKGKKNG